MINAVLFALQTQTVTSARLGESYDTLMSEWRQRTVDGFVETAERGELRAGTDPRATALAYFAFGLGLRPQTSAQRDVFFEDAELVVDQFLAAVAPA